MTITADAIREAIQRARTDPDLLEEARLLHASLAGEVLSRNHDRTRGQLRVSDAGACTRELWAKDRELLDIPEDAKGALRMDNGSLFGAWGACLLKAALEHADARYVVHLEHEVEYDGTPGHIDAAIAFDGAPLATVECKWTASPKVDLEAKPQHRLQSGRYGLAYKAPQHFVVVYYACAWAKGDYLVVHAFDTDETAFDVALEYERLQEALGDEIPEPNPPEEYLCKSCRYGQCERNQNPLRMVETYG